LLFELGGRDEAVAERRVPNVKTKVRLSAADLRRAWAKAEETQTLVDRRADLSGGSYFLVQSASDPRRIYRVHFEEDEDENLYGCCDCASRHACFHITRVMGALLLDVTVGSKGRSMAGSVEAPAGRTATPTSAGARRRHGETDHGRTAEVTRPPGVSTTPDGRGLNP
jgi:hypothetical protein